MESIEDAAPATKKCPFCAEVILAEAKKCRYCGEFLEAKPSSRQNEPIQRILAIAGSLLLVLAPFAPFLSAPILGRITLFRQGKGDGVVLLVVALVALGSALFGRYGFLWVSGSIGAFETGNLFWFFYHRLPELIDNYRRQTRDNIFGSIGEITLSNVDPDWGAVVLLLGTLTSLGVAIRSGLKKKTIGLAAKIGGGLLIIIIAYRVLVIAYQILLVYFPYLKDWPSLLGL